MSDTPDELLPALAALPQFLKEPATTGRPTKYTPELASTLLIDIATSPDSVYDICKRHGVNEVTINAWKLFDSAFSTAYERARQLRADVLADSGAGDLRKLEEYIYNEENDPRHMHARTGLVRAKIGYAQWWAGKLNPRYADRPTDVTVNIQSDARQAAWEARRARATDADSSEIKPD